MVTSVVAAIVVLDRHVEVIRRDAAGAVTAHFVVASFVGCWVAHEPSTGPEAGAVAWVAPVAVAGMATTDGLAEVIAAAARIAAEAGA